MSQLDPISYSDAQLRGILERVRTIAMVHTRRPRMSLRPRAMVV